MSVNLGDRYKINYKHGLEGGRWVYVRACKVVLRGVPVSDKLIGLSQTQKKKLGFDAKQISKIESKCPLEVMDVTLLHAILFAFGNLSAGTLKSLLKDLKDTRNEFAHEEHNMVFNKTFVKKRLNSLKILYVSILNELKKYADPTTIPLLDQDIHDVGVRLADLMHTLDDHIVDKTVAMCKASSALTEAVGESRQALEEGATALKHSVDSVDESVSALLDVVKALTDFTVKEKESSTTINEDNDIYNTHIYYESMNKGKFI